MLEAYLNNGYRGHITAGLLHKAVEIRELLASADSRNIMGRYEVGRAIHELREDPDPAYGNNPEVRLVKLAKLLGHSESLIRNLAEIARTWPDAEEFARLAARTNWEGKTLTLSHFIELTREPNADYRERAMDEALQGRSAAELAAQRRLRSEEALRAMLDAAAQRRHQARRPRQPER
jgi:hypothetical protein